MSLLPLYRVPEGKEQVPGTGSMVKKSTLQRTVFTHRRQRLIVIVTVGTAVHECVSDEALVHLKSYKYSSVDKSLISKYILKHYVCYSSHPSQTLWRNSHCK